MSFLIFGGKIHENQLVFRTCGTKFCVNPNHLIAGYRKGNRGSVKDRFWNSVNKTDYCWLWTGVLKEGYGVCGSKIENTNLAHRVSWILKNGSIPEGLFVCHRCDNPPCVNPDHLFLGTNRDNMRDAVSKGRIGVLNEEKVIQIRRLYKKGKRGFGCVILGRMFNTSQANITAVVNGWTWTHVPMNPV